MGHQFNLTTLKKISRNYSTKLNLIIMNSFAFVLLSLAAIATAAPGGWRCGRSPGWCKNKGKSSSGQAAGRTATAPETIVSKAIATPALSTLVAAVQAAGLVETLSGKGDFTVFAPTNDAFAKIPEADLNGLLADKDALTAVLLRHVLPTRIMAGDIPSGTTTVETVGKVPIDVINNANGVSIKSSAGSANVIATDINTSNGVVHLVDTVF